MKKILKLLAALIILIMINSLSSPKTFATNTVKNMTILFTHDMHDHFLPIDVQKNGKSTETGGYARLQTAIKAERKLEPNLVLVDAGDFSMGTLFQSIYGTDAPELKLMGTMGYDAVTLGNHEFDFRAKGLTDTLNSAKNSGEKIPKIVAANITFPVDKEGQLTESLSKLKIAISNYGIKDYTVIVRNGYKIGIFGLLGKDAASNAPKSEVEFDNEVTRAKEVVKILKATEKVDLIICLSHSGTWADKSQSEDEILAKKVPEINIIISGHTHTKLDKPILVGKTIIGSCGEYGENLGIINISKDENSSWSLNSYRLEEINKTIVADQVVSKKIQEFKKIVQTKYLDKYSMKFDEVLAKTTFNFVSTPEIGVKHAEDTLGNLISDSYIYAVKKAEGKAYVPITAAFEPAGTIRGSFVKGNITVSDAFTVSSLGIGADGVSGYPLISVYLTGKELKTACEVDASIAPIMSSAQLYMSGINFTFNPNRLIFNKVTKTNIQHSDGTIEKIDNKKLYRVIVGLYSAQMLSVVGDKSFGLLSLVPKTKEGKKITDFEAQIIKDKSSGHPIEVKEWLAIAEYLKSFKTINGIPQIPQYYNELHGRKVVDDNHSILARLSNPNGIALIVYGIVLVLIAIIIFAIYRLVTIKKRREKRNGKNRYRNIFSK